MRRFFSTTLGQIVAIIATSSAITFVLFLVLLSVLFPSPPPPPPWPWQPAYRITSLVENLEVAPKNDRAAFITAGRRHGLQIRFTQVPAPCEGLDPGTRDLEAALRSELGALTSNITVRSCGVADPAARVQVLIGFDDQTLEVRTSDLEQQYVFKLTFPFVGALLFLCVAVAAMSAWAVWRVIRPLRRLSAKAEAFGRNIAIAPIEEEGPLEIRSAAQSFNMMQERITRSIRERTRMLAAISHDLRTPLTRMRLQLEMGWTEVARGKLLRDIGLMQSMVTSALAYLSGGFEEEEKDWLDLGALLATLPDEYEGGGVTVSYDGPEQIRFFCRPNAINRALTNLVENGIHFGGNVLITASIESGIITIEVSDDGPGIPKDRMQDVVEPFVRLDPSRSNRPGSVGLGLSIVKEIVQNHAGTLELINREPRGLVARLRLPHTQPEVTSIENAEPRCA